MGNEGDKLKVRDKGLLEAALFLASKPVSRRKLAKILGDASCTYVDRLLDEFLEELTAPERGIELHREGEMVKLQVKQDYIDSVAHLAPQQDIPRPILRSLAMIAYNHPMTQSDLVKARGNKAYGHVQELIERGLVRAEEHGRTLLLHVTSAFLRYFGLSNVEEFRFHVKPSSGEESAIPKDESTITEDSPFGEDLPPVETRPDTVAGSSDIIDS